MTTLIHLDPHHGPVGAWRYTNEQLDSWYPPEYQLKPVATSGALMRARGTDVPWDEWLRRLAQRHSHTANFDLIEDTDEPLHEVYDRYRKFLSRGTGEDSTHC